VARAPTAGFTVKVDQQLDSSESFRAREAPAPNEGSRCDCRPVIWRARSLRGRPRRLAGARATKATTISAREGMTFVDERYCHTHRHAQPAPGRRPCMKTRHGPQAPQLPVSVHSPMDVGDTEISNNGGGSGSSAARDLGPPGARIPMSAGPGVPNEPRTHSQARQLLVPASLRRHRSEDGARTAPR
jgi:hypothetical protein